MGFVVRKVAQTMVKPARPTPSGKLELSAIDRLPALSAKVRSFHVFERGSEPGKVIREALAETLVYYYPFAGRLARPDAGDGELYVDCTSDGVWYVEATAECCVKEVNDPQLPMHGDLLPEPPPGEDPAGIIMQMQVTQFECGGFILGLENSHCLADGLGTAQFINAIAELARGLPSPTIEPSWCPEAIPSPPKRSHLPSPPLLMPLPQVPTFRLHRATIDLSLDSIRAFKSHFFSTTSQTCSLFESLAATLWQSRTRAVATDPTTEFRLVFMANARPFVHPPLPPGFCSNCFFPVTIKAPGGWLTSATVAEVVMLIKEAKGRMAAEFRRWAAGEWEEDPYLPALGYGTLFVSEWSRLGFEEVDFGWGKPKQVVPLTYSDLIPVCILGSTPVPEKGVRLSTHCVEEDHLRGFKEEMEKAWDVRYVDETWQSLDL